MRNTTTTFQNPSITLHPHHPTTQNTTLIDAEDLPARISMPPSTLCRLGAAGALRRAPGTPKARSSTPLSQPHPFKLHQAFISTSFPGTSPITSQPRPVFCTSLWVCLSAAILVLRNWMFRASLVRPSSAFARKVPWDLNDKEDIIMRMRSRCTALSRHRVEP